MTAKRNGTKVPDTAALDKLAKLPAGGGMGAVASAYLAERTARFQKATGGKGKPQIYGGKRA